MTRNRPTKNGARALLYSLIASTTMLCTLSGNGWAMLAPPSTGEQPAGRAADMKTVQTALESKIVRERLKTLGLTDKEIESRLTRLSDQQVHQLAKDVNSLSSGGFVEGLLVLIILVLVIVFLVHHLH